MNRVLRIEYKREGNELVFKVIFDDISNESLALDRAARVIYGSWKLDQ